MSLAQVDADLKVMPARLSFLAIYSPELGRTEEAFKEQIVFYHSRVAHKRRRTTDNEDDKILKEEANEKMRQIGLAQGMIHFANDFSRGGTLDQIETEKSRIVTHELERGWWILASIDLTRIPSSTPVTKSENATGSQKFEYSAREISPPSLLIQQLERAHDIFKLHNGISLKALFERLPRAKFCSLLERFWTRFALSWDVMLHGVPAAEVFGGMQLAAGGELGVGVGEEEWGAGEREVLEDFARRTDGLIDMVVSRFGDAPKPKALSDVNKSTKSGDVDEEPWMGIGREPMASDGVVFSGLGTVSRSSMRDISNWIQLIYAQGEAAYAVKESPSSDRRRKRRDRSNRSSKRDKPEESQQDDDPPPGIPRPIIAAAERSLEAATVKADTKKQQNEVPKSDDRAKSPSREQETWKKYLTLGYGTSWGTGHSSSTPEEPVDAITARIQEHIARENGGHFLIGLQGDADEETVSNTADSEPPEWNHRIMIRSLNVVMYDTTKEGTNSAGYYKSNTTPAHPRSISLAAPRTESPNLRIDISPSTASDQSRSSKSRSQSVSTGMDSATTIKQVKITSRVRVLVYAHRPFIYALLFDDSTATLMMPTFYRDLHAFLAPLQPLLARRTGPSIAFQRRAAALGISDAPASSSSLSGEDGAWEVVHDAATLATCANVPGISDGTLSRADALNLHSAALEVLATVRTEEVERRVKTARGWWVGWARVVINDKPTDEESEDEVDEWRARTSSGMGVPARRRGREIVLFRRAKEAEKGKNRSVSGWSLRGVGSEGSKLEDLGIGFDARRYVEGIMGFGRT
ncbi:hypothetical protein BT63DRAFT_65504 [Microthyrium microscopicum]|uniref:CCZ1/INTU/HSP4 first Longin domain-containing protein n=1 Tax=Microthyrium microscopicum TaxID=703497 RepID=A0A6A6U2B8_9PEZI|nr:hypothetical protein BT63DRAFT_65504 [Microthyrium microscopicum]